MKDLLDELGVKEPSAQHHKHQEDYVPHAHTSLPLPVMSDQMKLMTTAATATAT
jgi:hypothetical protein